MLPKRNSDRSHNGAYVCQLTLTDPSGWTLQPGGLAAAFVASAAREHGSPPVGAALLGGASALVQAAVASPDMPAHLGPPVPVPSPDHQQVHVSATEWQALTAGRWDRTNNKNFLKQHRQTEFHVEGDPFVYRTDTKGKVVAVYDAQKSYNITGTRKGVLGVPLTLNGEPTFANTPHMYPPGPPHKTVVIIDMQGSRPKDFRKANEEAGLSNLVKSQGLDSNQPPDGYTWHHRDDFAPNADPPPVGTCTMELVKIEAHEDTFVHYGSCDQVNKHVGYKLYQ